MSVCPLILHIKTLNSYNTSAGYCDNNSSRKALVSVTERRMTLNTTFSSGLLFNTIDSPVLLSCINFKFPNILPTHQYILRLSQSQIDYIKSEPIRRLIASPTKISAFQLKIFLFVKLFRSFVSFYINVIYYYFFYCYLNRRRLTYFEFKAR